MARCGMSLRYPVRLIIVHDDGLVEEGASIGEAENLREAVVLAERLGWPIREEGGQSRFVPDPIHPAFVVAVYPE